MARILDLFSCAGGAAMGYHRAGFDVVGVDIEPQPNYPFPHLVADALEVLAALVQGDRLEWAGQLLGLDEFDAIHASPPCQAFSRSASMHDAEHPDLLDPTRDRLEQTGLPWIIENVPGAPLRSPLTLCGSEFGLTAPDIDGVRIALRRHRLFESNVFLWGAGGCQHDPDMPVGAVFGAGGANTLAWRDDPTRAKGYIPTVPVIQQLLGIDWMSKREMAQVVPPAYTEFLGHQLHAWTAVAA